jgi:hypothetical protein
MAILKAAGITFVDTCMTVAPYAAVSRPYSERFVICFSSYVLTFSVDYSRFYSISPLCLSYSIQHDELIYHIKNNLGLNLTSFEVMLNGYYGFARGTNVLRGTFADGKGCSGFNVSKAAIDDYLGRVPAEMSNVYNQYFDTYNIDLMMGPADYCEKVTWSDELAGTCDNGNPLFKPGATTACHNMCHATGVNGGADKIFTKAKFIVPIGLTDTGAWFQLQFMSRAGPKNYAVPASEWVYDEEGPKTWNLEELYIVKRLYNILAAAGMKRADATLNYIDGFL